MTTARKIIKLGKDTLVVSLPSSWVRHCKLRKGSELETEEQGSRLFLYPKAEIQPGKVCIDVSGTFPFTKRILGALYKAGYDELEVKFESQDELKIIQDTIRESFVGFEILAGSKQIVVAKNISYPKFEEFDTLMRKVFLLLLEMGEGCYKAVSSGNMSGILELAALDKDINRHVNFCRRMLNTYGHRIAARIAPTYHLTEQLERTGDCYRKLCELLAKSGLVLKNSQRELLADANSLVRRFYNIYYHFDLQELAEFWKEKEKLEKKISEAFDDVGKMEGRAIALISGIFENLAEANGALLTARL